jgi:GAF domain-containing protein
MKLVEARQTLADALAELDADSCTFYVRDPFWPDELRLIDMPGVRMPEPMHGFSFPPHSKRVLAEGEPEIFEADSRINDQLREAAGTPLDGIAEDRRFLFGDFIEREEIKSSVRLWWYAGEDDKGEARVPQCGAQPGGAVVKGAIPDAVLFVNYKKSRRFDDVDREKVKGLLLRLVGDVPELREDLRASEMDAPVQAIRMFPPKHAGSATRNAGGEQRLPKDLESLLRLAVEALGLDAATTFGTVHLYNRDMGTLKLAAHCGEIKDMVEAEKSLSVLTGQGIISWVAIRRKAVLISDLDDSEFKRIHIRINEGVRSEVAIPIFDGKELLGVLNLESYRPGAFPRTCVRSLWFAVNRAAEAVRLSQQAKVNKRLMMLNKGLLELCAEAVGWEGVGNFSLDRLAELAAKELQAERCGIWRYSLQDFRFKIAGLSQQDFAPKPPRRGGWSDLIQNLELSVWIDIKEQGEGADFTVRYWNGEGWVQPPPEQRVPEGINPSVEPGVKSLLGIPIKVRKQRTGIAWLEYKSSPKAYTEYELMKLASGLAAYAGLVIEFSQVDLVDKNAVQDIGDRLSEELLAQGNLRLEGFPRIEVFVKSQNHGQSSLGGDFYAARVIDERKTAGVLLGDGKGHAVQGALNMLPLLTAFESFWKESRSVTHVMDKIMDVSKKLGVEGSAVYCVFTVIEETLWLSLTSAGHGEREAPLVFFPRRGGAAPFPEEGSPARGPMLGVKLLEQPLAEARKRLYSGDVIVIHTDGLEVEFNEVVHAAALHTGEAPGRIAELVFKAAVDKRAGRPFRDDATVLVIKVK